MVSDAAHSRKDSSFVAVGITLAPSYRRYFRIPSRTARPLPLRFPKLENDYRSESILLQGLAEIMLP
jgi:hypothetical protein